MDTEQESLLEILAANLHHMKKVVGTHHDGDTQVLDICLHMDTIVQQLRKSHD